MLKMTSFSPALALPLALMASLALAQSDTSADPAPSVEGDLSLGQEVSNTPQIGETYLREANGDWSYRCLKSADDTDPCEMYQLLADEQGGAVAEVSLFRLPEGGEAVAGATIVVPLRTSLRAQLRMKIDENTGRVYPFSFCDTIGCYARIGLTAEDVDTFKKGNLATLTIVPISAPDQTVNIGMSLTGFTASYADVSVLEQ